MVIFIELQVFNIFALPTSNGPWARYESVP